MSCSTPSAGFNQARLRQLFRQYVALVSSPGAGFQPSTSQFRFLTFFTSLFTVRILVAMSSITAIGELHSMSSYHVQVSTDYSLRNLSQRWLNKGDTAFPEPEENGTKFGVVDLSCRTRNAIPR